MLSALRCRRCVVGAALSALCCRCCDVGAALSLSFHPVWSRPSLENSVAQLRESDLCVEIATNGLIKLGAVLWTVVEEVFQRLWGILAVIAVRTRLDSDAVQVGV